MGFVSNVERQSIPTVWQFYQVLEYAFSARELRNTSEAISIKNAWK
jgi:hypothetical protein